jgi:CRP-like cAMP-binding protein
LLARARQYRFGRGEKVIEQGTQGESMFILMRGEASVLVGSNGEITPVASLRPGECFGEMSLLTGARRSATVVAHTDCEVVEIEKRNLVELLHRHPELLRDFSELLARRQLEIDGALTQTSQRRRVNELQRECAAGFFTRLTSFFEL